MADENNTGSTATEVMSADVAATPTPKKQRAKRGQKTLSEAVPASPSTAVKSPRAYRKKSGEQVVEAQLTSVETPAAGKTLKNDGRKSVGRNKAITKANPTPKPAATDLDEMADLIQLEDENKRLRKALSDKLRAENVDLRKRLGLN
jgi:putative transposase